MRSVAASARAAATIARRELGACFHAPIAYIAGVLFLVLQGFSFWAVVTVLADPSRPAPLGAVLHDHFGGTFLYWTVLLLYVSLVSMRLVAEERRQRTWEGLLTAPVSEEAVLAGKWLGGLAFYLILWLPTLAYPALLAVYAPVWPDLGPIAAAYLGVALSGMGFLAVGLAASAATANQIIAAVTTFAVLALLLLVGQIGDVVPGWMDERPGVAAVLAHIDVRGHMDALARGAITLGAVMFYSSLVAVGLSAAATAVAWGRRRRSEVRRRAAAAGLVAVIALCANVLAARHPVTWDVSRARVNSLDARTLQILADVSAPVDVLVVEAGLDVFSEVQGEAQRLLARMVAAQPLLRVRRLDPALAPERIDALAAEFAIAVDNLAEGGAVVFQHGARRRAVDLLDMAGFDQDDLGAGRLAGFRAEEAFATAIADITDTDRPVVCHVTGHGEMPMEMEPDGAGEGEGDGAVDGAAAARPHWGTLARRIERDGMRLEAVTGLGAGVPAHCRVLVVAGPERPLSTRAAVAVADFLADGGRLLLALSARIDVGATGLPATGLELVLARYGIQLAQAVVVDPESPVDTPDQWLTVRGYGDHPVSASFRDRRFTLWLRPRAVLLGDEMDIEGARARVLVRSSAQGWGETDLTAIALGRPRLDSGDIAGPVAVAVAAEVPHTGTRVVVFGSARSLSSLVTNRGAGAGELLAASALAWLGGRTGPVDIGAKTPEQLRLIMSRSQIRQTFLLCVVALPGAFALLGLLLWWRRRRG